MTVLTKDITVMVKNKEMSEFVMLRDLKLTYRVYNPVTKCFYLYDIPVEDTKGGTFNMREKCLFHTKWIREAINTNQFRKEV